MEKSGKTPIRGPEAYPLLEIVHGPKQGAWFTVAYQKELTLGRAATNSIILEDNSVSRAHSVLQSNGSEYTVRDIGSRNGTFVNQKKIQGEVPLKHLDAIKIGIYTLRFLEEPTEEAFELETKEEHTPRVEDEPQTEIAQRDALPSLVEGDQMEAPAPLPKTPKKKPDEKTINEDLDQMISPPPPAPQKAGMPRAVRNLFILLLIFGLLGLGGYGAYRFGALNKLKAYFGQSKAKVAQKKEEKTPPPKVIVPPKTTETPAGQGIPVLIEVNSTPPGAKVFYRGKELGVTPFKVSVQVPVDQPQELLAEFFLDSVGEKWTEKTTFQAKQQDELVTVPLQPRLGKLRVTALPKDGTLYLEGKFAGQEQSRQLKPVNIAFDTPILLPHGKYVAEIKVSETLQGSTSSVNTVKFRREFELSPTKGEFVLTAPDEAIRSFPAKILSNPPGAELLVDGKKVGDTPFDGNLPTGRHKLGLKKEGFNLFEQEISIELNTPFEATYSLITTAAGEYINKGRSLLKKGQLNEAIENLAEALKRGPTGTELSQVHILLGEAFLQSKTYDQAFAYYQKAAESPEYATQAELGMADAQAGLGQNDQALVRLIKVLVNTKDPKVQSQAESLYHKMYPMKSVLYIATQPEGASLSINGNPLSQVTPVILSDLLVGSYRVAIQKQGFKPFETRVTLALSTVKPLVITLEPAPQ
jgi:pSer/pThr/pTyr-binding forkhead associated (FHA) protein